MGSDLTTEKFERLLVWIAGDSTDSERAFESIRSSLGLFFQMKDCLDFEDLADETIDRVATKIFDVSENYQGDPRRYFYGVAKNVFRENLRRRKREATQEFDFNRLVDESSSFVDEGANMECLKECLVELDEKSRRLILDYYGSQKGNEKNFREELAEKYNISLNSLRVKIFRIKGLLSSCAKKCLNQRSGS